MARLNASADQLGIDAAVFALYAQREETRREHTREIVVALDLRPVRASDYRSLITAAAREAAATEQGEPITKAVIEALKDKGMSKERAAKIANSPKGSKHGGEKSHSGSGKSNQGGTTAEHKAAGRKGGKAAAKHG